MKMLNKHSEMLWAYSEVAKSIDVVSKNSEANGNNDLRILFMGRVKLGERNGGREGGEVEKWRRTSLHPVKLRRKMSWDISDGFGKIGLI